MKIYRNTDPDEDTDDETDDETETIVVWVGTPKEPKQIVVDPVDFRKRTVQELERELK